LSDSKYECEMIVERNEQKDEQLSAALREWKVDAPPPPSFQERVWQRIAAGEKPVAPPFWSELTGWLEAVFSRPALAVSYMAILLAIGVTTGLLRVEDKRSAAESEWRTRYVQSVDPYLMPGR